MQSVIQQVDAIINDGSPMPCDVEIHQDVEMVRSQYATKADPRWAHTDTHGHFHAWSSSKDNPHPTLRVESVEVPCNGSCGDDEHECEGFTETHYFCLICGERVKPGWVADYEAQEVGFPVFGRKSATVTVRGAGLAAPMGEQVTLQINMGEHQLIGVASAVNYEGGSAGWSTIFEARSLEPRLS